MQKLLTFGNAKIEKSKAAGWLTAGIHLAPHTMSGRNVCPMASAGCAHACLNTAGMGKYPKVQAARVEKTKAFFDNREAFMEQLIKEIGGLARKAAREGMRPAVRLNLTSDIQWENITHFGKTIFEYFPDIQFYDYTKIAMRFNRVLPKNYHLTFSRSEINEFTAQVVSDCHGGNVAVVFAGELPKKYMGRPVVDGDENDLRFLDPKRVIVGLKAKGRARKDTSGFVVNVSK